MPFLQYINPCKSYAKNYSRDTLIRVSPGHIIYSPELCIKDNSGKTNAEVSPIRNSRKYEEVSHYGYRDGIDDFNWWLSLESTTRKIDNEPVRWEKENK